MMHEIVLNGYTAHNSNSRCLHFGTAESYGVEQLHITPGADWENLLIKATFHPPSGDSVVVLLGEDGVIDVPPEATAVAAGEYNPGLIVFSGVSDGVQRISADIAYTVLGHAPVDGKDSEPTPNQWAQLAAAYQSKVDKQQGAENAGKFLAVGENGEVALSEGVKPEQIAAAVDAYLDENPIEAGATPEEASQIRQNKTDIETLQKDKLSASELDSAIDSALAQAKASGEFDGKDGEPGKDYTLTEADKQEIAQKAAALVDVPEALPNPNALTFTGAVTGSYDGSAPMTVEIPEGGAGGDGKTGGELVGTWSLEEEVSVFTVTLDEPISDGWLLEIAFVGTASNTAKKEPVLYLNGAAMAYYKDYLYESNMVTLTQMMLLPTINLLLDTDSFLYATYKGNPNDSFSAGSRMKMGAVTIKSLLPNKKTMDLSKIEIRVSGGVFGVGTSIRAYKINGI